MDEEFLHFIYQNAEMGVVGISQLQGKLKDENFRRTLAQQSAQYEGFRSRASDLLSRSGTAPKDIGTMARMGSRITAEYNAAVDSTTSHLAEMMIEGTNTGIVKLIQKTRAFPDAEQEVKDLAAQLISAEEANVQALKQFL